MSLQSLQLGYDKVEDRIVLLVQEGEGRQALLLTRKLCFALIEALGDIIHQGGVPQGLRAAPAAQQAELMAIVGLAAKTNQLATALQVPVDEVFQA